MCLHVKAAPHRESDPTKEARAPIGQILEWTSHFRLAPDPLIHMHMLDAEGLRAAMAQAP